MTDRTDNPLRQLGDDMARIFSPPPNRYARLIDELEHLLQLVSRSPLDIEREYGSTNGYAFLVGCARQGLTDLIRQAKRDVT